MGLKRRLSPWPGANGSPFCWRGKESRDVLLAAAPNLVGQCTNRGQGAAEYQFWLANTGVFRRLNSVVAMRQLVQAAWEDRQPLK